MKGGVRVRPRSVVHSYKKHSRSIIVWRCLMDVAFEQFLASLSPNLKAARPSTPPAMMVGPWLALRSLPLTPNEARDK